MLDEPLAVVRAFYIGFVPKDHWAPIDAQRDGLTALGIIVYANLYRDRWNRQFKATDTN